MYIVSSIVGDVALICVPNTVSAIVLDYTNLMWEKWGLKLFNHNKVILDAVEKEEQFIVEKNLAKQTKCYTMT